MPESNYKNNLTCTGELAFLKHVFAFFSIFFHFDFNQNFLKTSRGFVGILALTYSCDGQRVVISFSFSQNDDSNTGIEKKS